MGDLGGGQKSFSRLQLLLHSNNCDTNNCNVPELIDSAPTPDSRPTTKAKNGLGQIQSFTPLVSCQIILTSFGSNSASEIIIIVLQPFRRF